MPFTPKVGDKFRLLDKEWMVTENIVANRPNLRAVADNKDDLQSPVLYWPNDEADKLDWIRPEPKCSKEFAELVKKEFPSASIIMSSETRAVMGSLHEFVDAHTE